MEFEQIIRLIETVSASELTSFSLDNEEINIEMKKQKKEQVSVAALPVQTTIIPKGEAVVNETAKVVSGNEMKSPLVGTFYNAPSPDSEPFVKVGDRVKKGQTLGIIEAMKLMNEIECEYDGVVKEILADNMDMVEYGQTLFIIE